MLHASVTLWPFRHRFLNRVWFHVFLTLLGTKFIGFIWWHVGSLLNWAGSPCSLQLFRIYSLHFFFFFLACPLLKVNAVSFYFPRLDIRRHMLIEDCLLYNLSGVDFSTPLRIIIFRGKRLQVDWHICESYFSCFSLLWLCTLDLIEDIAGLLNTYKNRLYFKHMRHFWLLRRKYIWYHTAVCYWACF